MGQLGNRVQHALRAFTPKDRKTVRAAAKTLRENPDIDTEEVITELGVGESLVSVLDSKGAPTEVARVLNAPPRSRIGPLSDEERAEIIGRSPLSGVYDQAVDRESAYELLKKKEEELAKKREAEEQKKAEEKAKKKSSGRQSTTEAFIKSMFRSIGSQVGRQIVRGILGSFKGK